MIKFKTTSLIILRVFSDLLMFVTFEVNIYYIRNNFKINLHLLGTVLVPTLEF